LIHKNIIAEWLVQQLEYIFYDIKDFNEPYDLSTISRMVTPCAKIKIIYDLIDRFDIDIGYVNYNKYKKYSLYNFS
jgi:hypothetical protein